MKRSGDIAGLARRAWRVILRALGVEQHYRLEPCKPLVLRLTRLDEFLVIHYDGGEACFRMLHVIVSDEGLRVEPLRVCV